MRRVLALLSLAALPLAANACKTEDEDSVSRADAPAVTASEGCQSFFDCECGKHIGAQPYETESGCVDEFAKLVDQYLMVGDNAGLTYNGECIDDLRDALNAMACDGTQEVFLEALSNQDLALALTNLDGCKLFYGSGEFNDACERLDPSDPGLGDDCAKDLVCTGGTCRDPGTVAKPQGEACVDQEECQAGLICAPITSQDDSRCEPLPAPGSDCLGLARFCDPEGVCNVETNSCERLPTQGEACAPMPNLITGMDCAPGYVCSGDFCDAAPAIGEACPDDICEVGAVCTGGTCQEDVPYACLLTAALYGQQYD